MKNNFTFIVVLLALLLSTQIAVAKEITPYTFALVDVNKVMLKSKAAKSLLKQLDEKRALFHKKLVKEEKKLKEEEKEIISKREKMTKDEFKKKRQSFGKKVLDAQKKVQNNKVILDRGFNTYMNKLRMEATKIVAKIAKNKKYAAVFTQNAVLLSDPSLDITSQVVKTMNKEVKDIKVDWKLMASKKPKKGKK